MGDTAADTLAFVAPVVDSIADSSLHLAVTVNDGRTGTATAAATVRVYVMGDVNQDSSVNVGDLQMLIASWGSSKASPASDYSVPADLNADGYINVGDLQLVVSNWGRSLE